MFELKILELAKEYKENRDAYMRVRAKTKKKIRNFERWLTDNHLTRDDIIESERLFFEFCNFCKEVSYFKCLEFNLSWSFELDCKCSRTRKELENDMKERIKKHREGAKYEMQRLF